MGFRWASLLVFAIGQASAQVANNPNAKTFVAESPEVDACKATGLLALKERSPAVKDIILDMDTLTISKANTKIEDTPVHTIIIGDVYIERKDTGKSQQFLCIIGEKGKVLLTFFTDK